MASATHTRPRQRSPPTGKVARFGEGKIVETTDLEPGTPCMETVRLEMPGPEILIASC